MSRVAAVVETVARGLADDADAVRVVEGEHRGTMLVEVFMAPGDIGRAIGRHGRTASAIRALAAMVAEREGRRVEVEFRDEPSPGA